MIEKSKRITVRFTPEGEKWVIDQAEKAGVSKGRYLREVALGEIPQAEAPFNKKDRALNPNNGISQRDLEQVLDFELPKIGNNLNQLTRHVNTQKQIGPKQLEEIQLCREELAMIGRVIIKALK